MRLFYKYKFNVFVSLNKAPTYNHLYLYGCRFMVGLRLAHTDASKMKDNSTHVDNARKSGVHSKNNSVKVCQKGLTTLVDADLHEYLTNISVGDVFDHKNCCKMYTDERAVSEKSEDCQVQEPATKKLNSSSLRLDYKTRRFLCDKIAVDDCKHRDLVVEVRMIKTRHNVMKHCDR